MRLFLFSYVWYRSYESKKVDIYRGYTVFHLSFFFSYENLFWFLNVKAFPRKTRVLLDMYIVRAYFKSAFFLEIFRRLNNKKVDSWNKNSQKNYYFHFSVENPKITTTTTNKYSFDSPDQELFKTC